ncbi:SRPBCC family protein [Chitinimonas koreensis]|uniref:SRPBCC family protein n=1 Tax=Chitinimonas koreensis TaxID=356302 RepID=UPI0003FDDF70|nr:SRPBCC family protein [Chitinimonas koreensis]QNM96007.1 SRPBCC family protein [Chitinimonas koreensis]
MRMLKKILLGAAIVAVLLAAVGLALPSHFEVYRTTRIDAPPARVFALVDAPREWKRWTVWNRRDPAMKIAYGGPERGVNASWSWQSATEGNGSMTFVAIEPGRKMSYRLEFPDFGMTSIGVVLVEPEGSGSKVTWTNEGELGMNPVNRYFGLFMDRMVGPDFEAGLANLKALAEQPG